MGSENFNFVNIEQYVAVGLDNGCLTKVLARKFGYVYARKCEHEETVVTYIEGGIVEKEAVAKPGDWILTKCVGKSPKIVDSQGHHNCWIVTDEVFNRKYEATDTDGLFRAKPIQQEFVRVRENIEFMTKDRTQKVESGGFVNITNKGDYYGVAEDSFGETYVFVAPTGKHRVAIYNFFYNNPLINYQENGEIKLLIIGSGIMGNETLKAAFSCGQIPDTKLSIRMVDRHAKRYGERLVENTPSLLDFAIVNGVWNKKYNYASIDFDDTKPYDVLPSKDEVVFVCLDDIKDNKFIADTLKEKGYENIVVFTNNDKYESRFGLNDDVSELKRLASNLDFLYQSKYAYRNKKECKTEFEENFEKFTETVCDDYVCSLMTKETYDIDSSFACVCHFGTKLKYLDVKYPEFDAIHSLVECINKKDEHFVQMAHLEHRRWNAFMVMRGYRSITERDKELLYSDGFTNKNKVKQYHVCLCDSDYKKPKKLCDPVNASQWDEMKISDEYDDLDKASFMCHRVLADKAQNIDIKTLESYTVLNNNKCNFDETLWIEFNEALDKLINDKPNAFVLFDRAKKALCESTDCKTREAIEQFYKDLNFVSLRNRRDNFIEYDKAMIEFIPLCLLIDNEYANSIVTVVNKYLMQSVLAPWVLSSDKALFILKDQENDSEYKENCNRIKDFFKVHGDNTHVVFEKLDDYDSVSKETNKVFPNGYILYETDEYRLPIRYEKQAKAIMSYSPSEGFRMESMKDYSDKPIQNRLPAGYISISDYFKMILKETKEDSKYRVSRTVCKSFEKLYWEHELDDYGVDSWTKYIVADSFLKKDTGGKYVLSKEESVSDYQKKVLERLKQNNDISSLEIDDESGKVSFVVENPFVYKWLTEKAGNYLETYVYFKLLDTGLFKDVQRGVDIKDRFGENEIDVIALNDVTPLYVSCKATPKLKKEMLNEIKNEASEFGGIPVLATSIDIEEFKNEQYKNGSCKEGEEIPFLKLAKRYGIAILDRNDLYADSYSLIDKLTKILKQ